MTSKRKICIVTGSRAEYGLLYWLMKEVSDDTDLQLQIIATGMHLSPEFGLTFQQIEADGFTIDAKIEMLLSSDSPVGIAKSMGVGVIGFADVLARLKPDILVVLGDRFEMLAAAQVALVLRIPIAHIHGGETTEGAFDEGIRHAITKMAQWHFVAAEPYRKRVIQLGETSDRVFNFGAPGLDYIQRLEWMNRSSLEKSLAFKLATPVFLVTYHSATLGQQEPIGAMNELLAALDEFSDATVVFTYPNADTGGRGLIARLNQWVAANKHRATACASLGQQRYLSLMRESDVILGNSSSALTEAPVLKKATVNIGDRQKGRLKATSVIDAEETKDAIAGAIRKALSEDFRAGLPATKSLYGSGNVSRRVKNTLKVVSMGQQKSFFDIEHGH
ncbi:MAG: UDP-N-acetylglucosamine 2-epimerase (hydrolyzing) [Nitrospira sp.]|nr:MAG: UDP-N-acetylglucosamine 2-epimerase (hydrolyzing) [Nitrospira sp.]